MTERPHTTQLLDAVYEGRDDQVSVARTASRQAVEPYPYDLGDLLLLVSELITNCLVHAKTPKFGLTICVIGARLRVAVTDSGTGAERPTVRHSGPSEEGGRGLWLVDAVAADWEAERSGDGGLTVWFELDPEEATV